MLSASNQWNNAATTAVMPHSSESSTVVSKEDSLYYAWKCDPDASTWTIASQAVAYQTLTVTESGAQQLPTAMCAKRSITVTQELDRLVVAASTIAFTTPSTALAVAATAAQAADVDPITITPEWFQIYYACISGDRTRLGDDYAEIEGKLKQLATDNPQIQLAIQLWDQYCNFTYDQGHNDMYLITTRYESNHNRRIKNTILTTFKEAAIAHYQAQAPSYNKHGELANRLEVTITEVARAKKLAAAEILMAMLDQQSSAYGLDDVAPEIDAATTTTIRELDDETAILAKTYFGNQPCQQNLKEKIEDLRLLRDEVAKADALTVLTKPTTPIKPTKPAESAITNSHRKLFVKIRNTIKVIAVLAAMAAVALIMTGVVVLPPVLPFV
jgi:hypothetical protein